MPIFISYSHADRVFVNKLAASLVKHNAHVWIDSWEPRFNSESRARSNSGFKRSPCRALQGIRSIGVMQERIECRSNARTRRKTSAGASSSC
jgi:hypothetical protein